MADYLFLKGWSTLWDHLSCESGLGILGIVWWNVTWKNMFIISSMEIYDQEKEYRWFFLSF